MSRQNNSDPLPYVQVDRAVAPAAAYRAQLERRFWSKVDKTPGCWLWTGAANGPGYGNIGVLGQNRVAHRVAWLLTLGDLPAGLVLDHTCRNPKCVNPAHLEPVTHQENVGRGLHGALHTHCVRGHNLSAPHALTTRGRCRPCFNADMRKWRTSQRQVA